MLCNEWLQRSTVWCLCDSWGSRYGRWFSGSCVLFLWWTRQPEQVSFWQTGCSPDSALFDGYYLLLLTFGMHLFSVCLMMLMLVMISWWWWWWWCSALQLKWQKMTLWLANQSSQQGIHYLSVSLDCVVIDIIVALVLLADLTLTGNTDVITGDVIVIAGEFWVRWQRPRDYVNWEWNMSVRHQHDDPSGMLAATYLVCLSVCLSACLSVCLSVCYTFIPQRMHLVYGRMTFDIKPGITYRNAS